MLLSLTDMLTWTIAADAPDLVLSDLVFDAGTRQLVYLSLGTGMGGGGQALAPASLMGRPDPETRRVPLRITEEELNRAPHWTGETAQIDALFGVMPPLVVGPFGATHTPLALAAMLGAGDDAEHRTDPRAEAALDRYDRLGRWLERPVFGRDAEMGHLADILWNAEANRLDYFIVARGGFFSQDRRALPFSTLSHRAPGAKGGHLVLDLLASEMETAPTPDHLTS